MLNESDLSNFTGAETWHRYSPLFRKVLLTDGAKYVADEAGSYWLMDAISSHLMKTGEPFVVATLTLIGSSGQATLALDDGNGNVFARQDFTYCDFPLPQIKLYAVRDGANTVLMLKNEY